MFYIWKEEMAGGQPRAGGKGALTDAPKRVSLGQLYGGGRCQGTTPALCYAFVTLLVPKFTSLLPPRWQNGGQPGSNSRGGEA